MRDEPQSTALFDAMAAEYDVLEPWYEHLYARLHAILRSALALPRGGRARALDAGCGHGFQTAELRRLGYDVHGIDLAAALLTLARRRVDGAQLVRGDVAALPYPDGSFDVVVCCGSTLSFVAEPERALGEIARVLRPGGRLLLECERRWTPDLGWTLASALTGDPLGYGVTPATVLRAFRRPWRAAIRLPYPAYGILTLFSSRELREQLAAVGLRWRRSWGIHAVTNVLPSTVLHRARLPRPLAAIYRGLCRLDAAVTGASPARALANSLVILAEKG